MYLHKISANEKSIDEEKQHFLPDKGSSFSHTVHSSHNYEGKDILNELIDFSGFGPFQKKVFWLCGFIHFVNAFQVALLSLVLPIIRDHFKLDNLDLSIIGCCIYSSMILGTLLFGIISDNMGRYYSLNLSFLIMSLFSLFSSLSPSFMVYVVMRSFVGFCYGANNVVLYTYLTEFLPSNVRGYYLACQDVFFAAGSICSIGLSWIVIPTIGWRWMIVFSSIPSLFLIFLTRTLPESPRFLIMKGNLEQKVNRDR